MRPRLSRPDEYGLLCDHNRGGMKVDACWDCRLFARSANQNKALESCERSPSMELMAVSSVLPTVQDFMMLIEYALRRSLLTNTIALFVGFVGYTLVHRLTFPYWVKTWVLRYKYINDSIDHNVGLCCEFCWNWQHLHWPNSGNYGESGIRIQEVLLE